MDANDAMQLHTYVRTQPSIELNVANGLNYEVSAVIIVHQNPKIKKVLTSFPPLFAAVVKLT